MSLLTTHDALLLDLDGTVWAGGAPIDGAVDTINTCGLPSVYVTNNASRSPEKVASMLREIGLNAQSNDVLTSAQAAITLAKQEIPAGAKVLIVGAETFRDLARAAGFQVVASADDEPAAVLQGFDPSVGWADLTEAALSLRKGARYFASNLDTSLPIERGLAVGNGSLVAAVTSATGVKPESTGKPGPEMFLQAARQLGSTTPLVAGDRLNTDILGGNNADMDTFHVLTGVSGHMALIEAPAEQRPNFLGRDLRDLSLSEEEARPGAQGGFTARFDGQDIRLENGDPGATSMNALRTVLEVAWALPTPPRYVRPCSDAAEAAVESWW